LKPDLDELRAQLEAARRRDEVISPIVPERLAGGAWWSGPWPARLRAGVLEPKDGYRFRPENVVLPTLLQGSRAARVVELGAGSGSLLLAAWEACEATRAAAVELQADGAERLGRTLQAHGLSERVAVVEGDLRDLACLARVEAHLGGLADLVVMNPPFFPVGWGQPSSAEATRRSTHAEFGDVTDFLKAAHALLAPEGCAWVVYDAARAAELLAAGGSAGLALSRWAWISDQRPDKAGQPFRVWAQWRRAGAQVERLV
jgi:tRNA1(Val) A37 N6-methylase TrmN6